MTGLTFGDIHSPQVEELLGRLLRLLEEEDLLPLALLSREPSAAEVHKEVALLGLVFPDQVSVRALSASRPPCDPSTERPARRKFSAARARAP